jgi:ectoine hydroxylase-related dioxygenase (phytanoyl-CoA dioxygenase family)
MAEPISIADADIAAYERDGVVCLRAMFGADWLDFLAEAVELAMAEPGPHAEEYADKSGKGRFFGDLELWLRHDAFRTFALQSPAARIAAEIMRASRINFFYDQLLVKEPGTGERTPWHQDQPYWAVSGRQVCSIWLPLDAVAEETCVEYIAGSHNWPAFSPYHFMDGSAYEGTGLPDLPDIEAERERLDIRRFALAPGDCLVFQAMIVHGAPANMTANRRRALATRWCGDDARFCVRPGKVSIPTADAGLAHGDLLDCARFPLVWQAAAG